MKIKKILFMVIMIAFSPSVIIIAEEISALEQAYKEQYDKYTLEIKELQISIDRDRASLDKEEEIVRKLHELDLQDRRVYGRKSRYPESDNPSKNLIIRAGYLQKKIDRMKELSEKKSDLKIKVLEKKGSLPSWWIE